MSGYVDIHTHLLPGIDDGPRDLSSTVAMARAAAESGTATIAATPHLRTDFPDVHVQELAARCEDVRVALRREEIPLRVVSGAEVSLSWALDASDEDLRLASYEQRGSDLLIEIAGLNVGGVGRLLHELQTKGYRITLAHPERNWSFYRDDGQLRALVEQGVLLQVNAEALFGRSARSRPRRLARHLCVAGLAHAIASDGHRAERWRPVTELSMGVRAAIELVGRERAEWMSGAAPNAIMEGAELPDAPPVAPQRRRRRILGRG